MGGAFFSRENRKKSLHRCLPYAIISALCFRSGAAVAQVTVNHLVAGSNPAFGAIPSPVIRLVWDFGGLAQLVEQRNHNPRVGGSCPSPATNLRILPFRSGAAVAQVTVNHLVAGSNPAFGATFARCGFSPARFFCRKILRPLALLPPLAYPPICVHLPELTGGGVAQRLFLKVARGWLAALLSAFLIKNSSF